MNCKSKSFHTLNNPNTKSSSTLRKDKSPPKIANDKIVFIKTQFKGDIANFNGYGII